EQQGKAEALARARGTVESGEIPAVREGAGFAAQEAQGAGDEPDQGDAEIAGTRRRRAARARPPARRVERIEVVADANADAVEALQLEIRRLAAQHGVEVTVRVAPRTRSPG